MSKLVNLLIIDDDRFIRRSLVRMLRDVEMIKVHESDGGGSIFDLIRDMKINCVLMDYYMSDITGLELMRHFKDHDISVPVIMLTGQDDAQLAARIMKAGAADYIPKSRLTEQDFIITLTNMITNAIRHHNEILEKDRAQIALGHSEARYRALIESSPILIVRFFPEEYMISFVNDYFCSYAAAERIVLLGENILKLIPESSRDSFRAHIDGITSTNPVTKLELKTLHDGEAHWQLWTVQGIFHADGSIAEYLCMGEDITDIVETREQLKVQKRLLQSILDSQDNMIIVAGREKVHEVNISFLMFFGFYSPDDMARNFDRVAAMTVEVDGYLKAVDAKTFWLDSVSTDITEGQYRMIAFRQEGSESIRYFSVKFRPLSIEADIFVVEFSDVTELEERSKEFENRSNCDALTKIYNRRRFLELLDRQMKTALHLNLELSMVFFDIDHFKKINDTCGHNTGDQVLRELASLISGAIRQMDVFARWGGEEFLLLLEATSLENAAGTAEKLRKLVMDYPFPEVMNVTCSFGVTSFHPDDTAETFINRADSALYRAKEGGRNRVIGLRKKRVDGLKS